MADTKNCRPRIIVGLLAVGLVAACGDNPGGNVGGAPAVALDRNVLTGPVSDISNCSRFPSRC